MNTVHTLPGRFKTNSILVTTVRILSFSNSTASKKKKKKINSRVFKKKSFWNPPIIFSLVIRV